MFDQPCFDGQAHGLDVYAYSSVGNSNQHSLAAVRQAKVQIGIVQIQHGLAMFQMGDRNSAWRAAQQGRQKMAQRTVGQQA